ncbi:hypothetical protein AVEN_219295-1 [Araneus ventricosus]|uniref:Uncharacterized protein n=1 Tax=Araneus ventricosus TaxID=182803 RepID=A0A4Y2BEH3_ARAVE|nr:hypothetical protein AVEN_219295-1 [Araneus ventricosus]
MKIVCVPLVYPTVLLTLIYFLVFVRLVNPKTTSAVKDILIPDSNFNLQQSCSNLALQICKLATNLTRQECKLETSYCKRVSHHKSNLPQACCVKLIANYSKNKVRSQPRIRTRDVSFPKTDALTIQSAGL